jgi:septal ring factor EnvC (AmiA/AmiB activator)
LHRDLIRLADLQSRADARTSEIAGVVTETQTQKTALGEQRKARATVLARLEGQINAQRNEAARLGQDDERLSQLISGLDVAIAKQAEDARKAEEARKQAAEEARKQAAAAREAARQAEIARKADEARQVADATRRAQAARREAELTRRQADQAAAAKSADASRRAAEARDAAAVRERADAALRRATDHPAPPPVVAAGRVIQSDARASIDTQVATIARTAPADTSDNDVAGPSTGNGLHKGLTPPVQGQIQGRFGLGRPDGGIWRGVVLRAAEGTPVHVVAAGTVVYAQWLRGFGNLIIVDHGDDYMSVYAYNQSVLKHVGDNVRAGETVALVGATGGQVESGLYFEIRHRGAPVDPAQWLAQQ